MSIQSEIARIQSNVQNTLSTVSEMGGTVADGMNSDGMAAAVASIPISKVQTVCDVSPDTSGNVALSAANISGLSAVASSGSYSDLTGTPAAYTLPAASPMALGGVKVSFDSSTATLNILTT